MNITRQLRARSLRQAVFFTLLALLALTAAPALAPASAQGTDTTTRVSVSSSGAQANGNSDGGGYDYPTMSADGRYVAFSSEANNLISGDTNGARDIFVHDRDTDGDGIFDEPGAISSSRVSVHSNGTQGNGESRIPSISANGRYVAFYSSANNLVADDTNGKLDIFVHDRDADGDGIFDEPGAIGTARVSVHTNSTQGDGDSWLSSISADGRHVGFSSYARNLVSGDTNVTWDVFVHDRQAGQTTRVSVHSDGTQGNAGSGGGSRPTFSGDGRYVAFDSSAGNLIGSDLDDDGRCDAGCDTSGNDIFVHDRQSGQTTLVSVNSNGTQQDESAMSFHPSISADGRYVGFDSSASNLVISDTNGVRDAFVHDRQTGQTTRVSVHSNGTQGNSHSEPASISANGRYVGFLSSAANLVDGDSNGQVDTFVHDRQTRQTTRASVHSNGTQGNAYSGFPSFSADGRYVAFWSGASNLVSDDTNGRTDIFVRDRGPQPVLPNVVNSTNDTPDANVGDGVCYTNVTTSQGQPECTLRAAIQEANARAGADTINFNVPNEGMVPQIWTSSALPEITDPVVIDGTTQPDVLPRESN